MDLFLGQFVSGLITAGIALTIATGLMLTMGTLKIANFAHGSYYMIGAYVGYTLMRVLPDTPVSFGLALLTCFVAVALLGVVVDRILLRRTYTPEMHVPQVLICLALTFIFLDMVTAIWGVHLKATQTPAFMIGSVQITPALAVPKYYVMVLSLTAVVYVGLVLFMNRTKAGSIIRAITNDLNMSSCLGVNTPRWYTLVFALGVGLAGLGGGLAAPLFSLFPGMDWMVMMQCFIIVTIGGAGSWRGALVGSLILGWLISFGIIVAPRMAMIFPYLALIVVLLVRPFGLFGRRE